MRYRGRDFRSSIPGIDLYDWRSRRPRKLAKRLFAKARRRWRKKLIEEMV